MKDPLTRVIRSTREIVPTLPFSNLKHAVLGGDYSLNIVFVSRARSQELNLRYRGKNKPTNTLSFALGKKEGELLLCLSQIKKEAPLFERSPKNLLAYLLIHGLFHLKGMGHGSRMESNEQRVRTRFNI